MNCLYIIWFFNIVAGIVQTFIKSWNQLLYPRIIEVFPPALWTTSWLILAPHHPRRTFSQRDVSLGEGTRGNRWARCPDSTADGPVYPSWIFPRSALILIQNSKTAIFENPHRRWLEAFREKLMYKSKLLVYDSQGCNLLHTGQNRLNLRKVHGISFLQHEVHAISLRFT